MLAVTVLAEFFTMGAGSWALGVMIKPITGEFGWSHAQLIGVLTMAGILGALVSPFLGRIVDRFGARLVMTLGLVFLGVMLMLTRYVVSLWQFYAIFGLSLALARPAVMSIGGQTVTANWFIRKRGIAFAALAAGTSTSGMVFPQVTQAMLNVWDWRTVWLVMGLALVCVAAPLAWLVIRPRPEDMGLLPDGAQADAPVATQAAKPKRWGRPQTADVSWTLKEAMRTPTFWLLNLSLPLTMFPAGTIFLVMHPYYTDLGISPTTAARLVSFYALTAFGSHFFWATAVQSVGIRKLLVPYATLYATGIALFVLAGGSSVGWIMLSILPLGLGISGAVQFSNQVFADYFGRKEIGSILGTSSLFRLIPSSFGPLLAAELHDWRGTYAAAFVVFSAFCFLAALGLFFARPPRKKVPEMAGAVAQAQR